MTTHHLAQINVARMRAELEDPVMHGFESRLDEINALADKSPGFVWRLETDDGNATSLRVFDDALILVNLSVWSSIEALRDFVYGSTHVELLRGKKDWFHPPSGAHLALWWVAAGELPTLEDAKTRLALIDSAGPGPLAFTFARAFSPDGERLSAA